MMMQRFSFIFGAAFLAACGGPAGDTTTDSAGGTAADSTGAGPAAAAPTTRFNEFGDRMGRIPVLEYHIVTDSSHGQWTISREKFQRDLQTLYDRGYRPITVAQLIDRDFSDVPAGMSPVVFTFDDASPEQFKYLERNGRLEIDPTSVVGMWMDFARRYPDWKGRATFCLLPAADNGHAFFGDKERFHGQKNEWRHQKVKWLADNGFELCNHTLWHAQLSKFPDAMVREQIARGQMAIDSAVPGYKVRTFAFPQGLWPKNRELAWHGTWTDPKSGTAVTYGHDTVLEVSGGPVRSPFDPQFDRRRLTRLIVFGNEPDRTLQRLDESRTRFVWDGGGVARQ